MRKNALDVVDRKIIDILLDDGRISFSELSKRVGLSRGMVANRVANLENSGVIKKYTALVSTEYFKKTLPVFFDIKVNPKHIVQAAETIATYEDIAVVYQMSGNSALHVHGFFNDMEELYGFINEKINTLTGVQDISIQFLLKKFKSDFV